MRAARVACALCAVLTVVVVCAVHSVEGAHVAIGRCRTPVCCSSCRGGPCSLWWVGRASVIRARSSHVDERLKMHVGYCTTLGILRRVVTVFSMLEGVASAAARLDAPPLHARVARGAVDVMPSAVLSQPTSRHRDRPQRRRRDQRARAPQHTMRSYFWACLSS